MSEIKLFDYDSVEALPYEDDGHYHLILRTLRTEDTYLHGRVDFVFDTGAYITIVTRQTADTFGFLDSYTIRENVKISGIGGECLADLKELPGLFIGGHIARGVKVVVPHVDSDTNLLGLNVLEHFKYLIDAESDVIYFARNPSPRIPIGLECKSVNIVSNATLNDSHPTHLFSSENPFDKPSRPRINPDASISDV